jgi:hypothetical protein
MGNDAKRWIGQILERFGAATENGSMRWFEGLNPDHLVGFHRGVTLTVIPASRQLASIRISLPGMASQLILDASQIPQEGKGVARELLSKIAENQKHFASKPPTDKEIETGLEAAGFWSKE